MKVKIIEKAKTICSNPSGIHNYFGWPSVARLSDGALMAVASGFRIAHVCPFGKVVGIKSYDEGKSWNAKLHLDLRDMVSYPDAVQDKEGTIYIIYDRDRYGCGEILCSKITEKDIEAGSLVSDESFAGAFVSRLFQTHKEMN